MITGKILKTYGWPEGKIIGLAKAAAEDLAKTGLEQGAILVWLDGVREEPGKYLADPIFATLARECLRRARRHTTRQTICPRPASGLHGLG